MNFFQDSTATSSLQRSIHMVLEFDGKLAQVKQSYVKAQSSSCAVEGHRIEPT
ncbi:LADA_0D02850g1_1 [Lachancea dasiensis]|uniref:LADA_0D02850g1_1 n=1 Tax=Lachancea dasiensis TaxID=1072105 RepID=A0A1G4J4I5_9SACH|nr:LADA_0D02850g1_1 [Lachancea dasiensis]